MSKLDTTIYGICEDVEIIEATHSDLKLLEKMGIQYNSQDFAVVKGTYLLVDKLNRNGHHLSSKSVKAAIGTLAGKGIDLWHNRLEPRGFYFSAELIKNKMVSKAIFWKGTFKDDFAKIVGWIKRGVAGQSFELRAGKQASINVEGKMGIDLSDIEFVGGAILPRADAAEPDTSLIQLARELKINYPDVIFAISMDEGEGGEIMKVKDEIKKADILEEIPKITPAPVVAPEEEDNDDEAYEEGKKKAALVALSWDTIREVIQSYPCPKCNSTYMTVKAIDFEKKTAKLECYVPECGKKVVVSYDIVTKACNEIQEAEVYTREDVDRVLADKEKEIMKSVEGKVFTAEEKDAEVRKTVEEILKEKEDKVAEDKRLAELKQSRLDKLEEVKPIAKDEVVDVSTEDKYKIELVTRKNAVLEEKLKEAQKKDPLGLVPEVKDPKASVTGDSNMEKAKTCGK